MKKTTESGLRSVSVAQLKAKLSEYLRFVKAGGEVVVDDRGRPVARIVRVQGRLAATARLEELAAAGQIRVPAHELPADFFRRERPSDAAGRSLEIVLEERAEDR